MFSQQLILHSSHNPNIAIAEFEDAFHHSKRQYSISHLAFSGDISTENLIDALEKALIICQLAGNNSKHHFQKIYVYEVQNETVYIDYKMSKAGFNLMQMQLSQLNESRAKWLWKLSEL